MSLSNSISLLINDRSGLSTAQMIATIPGPPGADTAKEKSHGMGARRPGF